MLSRDAPDAPMIAPFPPPASPADDLARSRGAPACKSPYGATAVKEAASAEWPQSHYCFGGRFNIAERQSRMFQFRLGYTILPAAWSRVFSYAPKNSELQSSHNVKRRMSSAESFTP